MSLHDTDATTGERTNPTVSSDDKVVSPMAHQTISTTYKPAIDTTLDRVQMMNKRILSYDDNGIKSIVLGKLDDGTQGFEVAQTGYDVTTATDDQKVMSSKFNMYKIIASGDLTLTPRNANITLTGTTIGYQYAITVYNILPLSGQLDGNLFVRVTGNYTPVRINLMDIAGSGSFYNDGTNKTEYNYHYYIWTNSLYIIFNVRLLVGSLTFNPINIFSGLIHWEICNHTGQTLSGAGAVLPGDGKYYYSDSITYNVSGTPLSPLLSTTEEFKGGESNHFPKPNVMIPGYKRW